MSGRNVPTLCIDALAVYRLTRLVTKDVITEKLREALVREAYAAKAGAEVELTSPIGIAWADFAEHDGNAPKLATLITCRWCAGMWVALGVVAARAAAPALWDPIARALAFSAAAALTARGETD
jgi:hypothetical protein